MPGRLIAKIASGQLMWSRVELANGDQIMVSMAAGEVKLYKMRGLMPVKTLATVSPGAAAIAWEIDYEDALKDLRFSADGTLTETFKDGGPAHLAAEILDRFTAEVLECSSAREVAHAFDDL